MNYIAFVYKWNSRELKKIILAILKSWIADDVKKINYIQNYLLREGKNIEKNEAKILLVSAKNETKLIEFLSKNFPQIERIYVN